MDHMNKVAVLYHKNCYDGFGAAWAAWRYFQDKADYIAVSYGDPLPSNIADYKDLFIVDFSYPPEVLDRLAEHSAVTVLDHHKTAEAALQAYSNPNVTVVFDMNRSGAGIAWDFFHKDKIRPMLINYIEDRDLWKFSYPDTKAVHAALLSHPLNFDLWNKFETNQLITEGEALLRLVNQQVSYICDKAWLGTIGSYSSIPMVNTSIALSDVGNELCRRYPDALFAACFTEHERETVWSLRSVGSFDVSAVAKDFGGGGHNNAAGFKVARY